MIAFENFLIEKGYKKFLMNCKTMKYEATDKDVISTMVNIFHIYVHENDKEFLSKINDGISVMNDEIFTDKIRSREIVVGLHEYKKPETLIYPRPKIEVKKIGKNKLGEDIIVKDNELSDDSMNICLMNFSHEEIFNAMYNKKIKLKIDLTKEKN